ncbi:hypothetical protein F0562_015123 [Nyssa sinensis]|uniref:Aminotransferase-like plant mobile domain-containing protein n=1 Tax=Nyssa sinensis TaxID=561372 RepID=A0A5J4ZHS9_9ASTE|nr:hypothetical protein F0562_015123 [Nyssa sinensis]
MKKATRRSSVGPNIGSNSVKNFSSRFSLRSFVKRVGTLSDSQRRAIESMGFGNLLQMQNQMICKNLLVELMERWSSEKRAFILLPGMITIMPIDVALILGIRATGDPVILKEDEPFSELEREYGAALWNRKITITSIEERLDSLGGIVNEDFIRSFLLFIFGTLLFPNANGKVDSRYLSLLQDLDKVCHFAWGEAVLEDIFNWLCRRKEINVQYVGGCLIFLQIWCYEHIDIARPSMLECPLTFPRVCRWGNSRSHHRQWFTSKFKELQKNQILWKLQLSSDESEIAIIKELLEAQSDNIELYMSQDSSMNVSVDHGNNVRIRPQMIEQLVIDLENESEMDIVRELHGAQEDCSEHSRTSRNVSVVSTRNTDFLSTFDYESGVQTENIDQRWISQDDSTVLIISDEDDDDDYQRRNQILEEQNMELQKKLNDLKKENELLKNWFTSSPMLEEHVELKKEVESLRRENQLLSLSSIGLVARLERLVFDENVYVIEEQSSPWIENEDIVVNHE